MYKYLIAFILITPLIGIVMVENGEYAMSIGREGYQNGAAIAYLVYTIIVVLVALAFIFSFPSQEKYTKSAPLNSEKNFIQFSCKLIFISSLFLLVMLYGFGAINVWLGSIGKGEFRAGLGPFGSIAYLMTKFVLPGLLAYSTLLYLSSTKNNYIRSLFFANISIIFVAGATWGFKSTSMAMLLPALLLMHWRIKIATLFKLILLGALSIVTLYFIFDSDVEETSTVFTFLLTRITVIQGDISWYIWDRFMDEVPFPSYWPTLLAAFGDNLLSNFGLSKHNQHEWMLYHYDWMMNYIADVPLYVIADGHSTTGTPFSEGLIAGGLIGLVIFSIIAGVMVGFFYRWLNLSLLRRNDAMSAIIATYFCFVVFPWLNAGAIVQLFHIATIANLAVTALFIISMRNKSSVKNFN